MSVEKRGEDCEERERREDLFPFDHCCRLFSPSSSELLDVWTDHKFLRTVHEKSQLGLSRNSRERERERERE